MIFMFNLEKGKVPMEKAIYEKVVSKVRDGIKEKISETHADLGLDVICSPFSSGVRVLLVKVMDRGVYPVATACANLTAHPKDIVHGLWETLQKRGKDEIRHLRMEAKKVRVAKG